MRALKLILTFLMICSFFYATTQTPNAVKDVERLIILYENESDPKKKLDLSSQIIQLSIYKSRWDLMKKYAIDMQGLAMQSQDKEKEIFALLNLGKAQFFDSKYTEAIESYEIGLEISTRERIQTYVRDLYKELGNVCFQVENFDGALTYNLRAHELAKAKNFQNTMSYTSTLFGDLYMELGQNDKALTRYKEARTYSINTSDSFKIAKDACVLAEFFTKLNKLDTASTFIEEGWNYFGEERKDEVRSRLMKAEVDWCFKKGQYDLALEKALKRHELLVRLKMGKDQVFCAIDIAKTYEKMDELQLGIKYSQLALKKAKKLNENRGMEGCYRILAKLFERQQKYDDAYLAQKQWLSLRDSISHGKLLRLFKDKEIQIAITEQKIEDQLLLERETQRNQKLYRSLIALVIFAFLLGIGGFVFYRLNKRNVQTSERLSSANNLLQLKTVALKPGRV